MDISCFGRFNSHRYSNKITRIEINCLLLNVVNIFGNLNNFFFPDLCIFCCEFSL